MSLYKFILVPLWKKQFFGNVNHTPFLESTSTKQSG